MAEITTSPGFRFGWQGATAEYVVKADGATQLSVPEQEFPGVHARVVDMKQTAEGVEARILVDVQDGTFV